MRLSAIAATRPFSPPTHRARDRSSRQAWRPGVEP
jgi:hypothetical protein